MKVVISLRITETQFYFWSWPEWASARLRQEFPDVEFAEFPAAVEGQVNAAAVDAAMTVLENADVVVTRRFDAKMLARAPQLRWLHCPAAAVHQLLTPELARSEVVLTNGASVHGPTVAEHAMALMLALARGLPQIIHQQATAQWDSAKLWQDTGGLTDLRGSTALLVGMGNIGSELARRLVAMGVDVIGIRRKAAQAVAGVREIYPPEALDDLLPCADWVVLAVPVTASTRALIGPPQLARMRRDARLINVGRGALVDEPALMEALRARIIRSAALDVFAQEPVPADSPLWSCERLLMTPHTGGVTEKSWPRQVDLIAQNLRRYRGGQSLLHVVDKHLGY